MAAAVGDGDGNGGGCVGFSAKMDLKTVIAVF
jgi:hypothetical protein